MPSLSYQATVPADDVVWSKPPCPVSRQPIPIPPRNEPHLSDSTVIDSIARFTGPLVSSGHASAPALFSQATLRADNVYPGERPSLSYQATVPADDVVWSKPPRPVSRQPIPIPPRNEPHLSDSTVIDSIASFTGPLVSSGHASAPALSSQATLRADDVIRSESPCLVSGQSTNPASAPALSYQATLRADDVVWSESPCPVSGQSTSYASAPELEGERLKVKLFHLLTIKLLTNGLFREMARDDHG
jgi:hypothetical protein